MRKDRNMDGVRFERLRKQWDGYFNQLHDELEEAYYGPKDENGRFLPGNGWRNSKTSPVFGLDCVVADLPVKLVAHLMVRPGQETLNAVQARQLFDLLHGAIWKAHTLWLERQNRELEEPYPETVINPEVQDRQGNKEPLADRQRRAIADLKTLTGIDIARLIKKRHSKIDLAK